MDVFYDGMSYVSGKEKEKEKKESLCGLGRARNHTKSAADRPTYPVIWVGTCDILVVRCMRIRVGNKILNRIGENYK